MYDNDDELRALVVDAGVCIRAGGSHYCHYLAVRKNLSRGMSIDEHSSRIYNFLLIERLANFKFKNWL